MTDPKASGNEFDASDVTKKIDFSLPLDEHRLRGRNVLITGGSLGLGAQICIRLAEKGALVTIADVNDDEGQKISNRLNGQGHLTQYVHTDVRQWTSQVNAFKKAISMSPNTGLDAVIPCAGLAGNALALAEPVSLDKDPPPPTLSTFDINLVGVYYSTLLALHYFRLPVAEANPDIKKQILFIGSVGGYLEIPPMADYTAAKFGVRGLWKTIRRESQEMGIRTNLIAPTFMPTQQNASVAEALEERGVELSTTEAAASAVLRCLADEEVEGRAVAIGGHGNFDLQDDYEGLDGGQEILKYFESGAMGAGMHTFQDVLGARTFDSGS